MSNIIEEYKKRKTIYQERIDRLKLTSDRYIAIRLGVFIAGVIGAVGFWQMELPNWIGWWILFSTIVFLTLIRFHQNCKNKLMTAKTYWNLNHDGIRRLEGKWKEFSDCGSEFVNDEHPFTNDLDIFGKNSLFQMINTARTSPGRQRLAQRLSKPFTTAQEIERTQKIVTALSSETDWRQDWECAGRMIADRGKPAEPLLEWANTRESLYRNPFCIAAVILIPVATVISILLSIFVKDFPVVLGASLFFVQLILTTAHFRKAGEILETAYQQKEDLQVYGKLITLIENSRILTELQETLKDDRKESAGKQLKRLVDIVHNMENRKNQVYFPINALFLTDFIHSIRLERWKIESGKNMGKWIEAISETETLVSLATLKYEHPEWTMPVVTEDNPKLIAYALGHPLIGSNCVCNDVEIRPNQRTLLITGSNMSGKSTLERTAGINLALAYCGAPVFASVFECSVMELVTCMRVKDDLDQHISSFYAELIRIKRIVELSQTGKPLIFLLDEIFKGTNSLDRHTGASVLIKKLLEHNTVGIVSTHDLELADLENETDGIVKNFHFQEHYTDNQIQFDYKLYGGVSTTRNAVYLMRLAGIDVKREMV